MRYKLLLSLFVCLNLLTLSAQPAYDYSKLQRENLGRGVIAIQKDYANRYIGWRYLDSDPDDVCFNVYVNDVKINATPTTRTNVKYFGFKSSQQQVCKVVPVIDGVEQTTGVGTYTLPGNAPFGYVDIPLDTVPNTIVAGDAVTYSANDATIADVDGDGEYEIILKWDPSNSKDNSQSGYTGDVFVDCYKLDGTHLWRIDMGKNIRAGAHYTQIMAYDLDHDGKAEVVMKTADGTVDGAGTVIGDATADYRNSSGYILSGPEYLTIFNGETGAAMKTINYIPQRGTVSSWGDSYGNRVDRFLAGIAFLDGEHPSVVMCRGYYTRTVLAAFDWDGTNFTNKWKFDSNNTGYAKWVGQGDHSLRVGDVDGDGCDEIVYGGMTIDHNGSGLYNTLLGHGDALHMTVFDWKRDGMQVWNVHETYPGSSFREARTGKVLSFISASTDVGRGMAADIDPTHRGVEMWSSRSGGILDVDGNVITTSTSGVSMNMAIWWDADLLRELQDGVSITKFDYTSKTGATTLLSATDCHSNNSTKSTPSLVADIYGDWREELLLPTNDNKHLRMYVNTDTTTYRFHTFLEDPVYRASVADENVAYNQPTQPGFYFGPDLLTPIDSTKITSDSSQGVTLEANKMYDTYKWSINGTVIGTERKQLIRSDEVTLSKPTPVTLQAEFRGYTFLDTIQVTLTKTTSTGIEVNGAASEISIYPNPVVNDVNVFFTAVNESTRFEILSLGGALIESTTISSGESQISIPVNQLSTGSYLLRMIQGEKQQVMKFIKK